MRNKRRLIYLNCFFYTVIIFLIVGKFIQSFIFPGYQLSTSYYFIVGLMPLISLVVMVGLIGEREWARICTISWNLCIAFLLIGLKLIGYIFLQLKYNISDVYYSYFDWDTIFQLIIGIGLILLSFAFRSKSMKEYFEINGNT